MNDPRESNASAERPIRRLLVRYGRFGQIAWFGTVHDLPIDRGDAVVVLTPLGEWTGKVLRTGDAATPSTESSSSSSSSKRPAPSLSGELLRQMDEADLERSAAADRSSSRLLELARQEVERLAASVTVIDASVSLCGRFAVVVFAGRSSAALGPATVRLADALALDRVQWVAAESPTAATEEMRLPGSGMQEGLQGSEGAKPEEGSGAGVTPTSEKAPSAGVLRTLRAIQTSDAVELGRLARSERERLGMIGAYSQKLRGEPLAQESQRAVSPQRRWMLRVRATAGGVTIGQLEQLAQLAVRHGDGSLRLTMRQGLQMHGVVPGSAGEVLRAVESLAMTTRGSCGNVFRNVTCCPLQPRSSAALAARQLASTVTQQWLPRAEWLRWIIDAEDAGELDGGESDAAYREGYLPHKWKVGVATGEDNCINVLTNDVGLVVHSRGTTSGGKLGAAEVDCYVGGSLAYRPGVTGSVAMLAEPLGRVSLADVSDVLEGLTQVHRQISAGGPRHWRRLKYLVRRLGVEALAERVEHVLGRGGLFKAVDRTSLPAWTGHPAWLQGIDGRWTRTVEVVGGRLRFGENQPGADWIQLCRYGRAMRIGPRHSLVIEGIEEKQKQGVDALIAGALAEYAAEPVAAEPVNWEAPNNEVKTQEIAGDGAGRKSPRVVACVALPTCSLAVAEAERTAADWRQALEPVVAEAAILAGQKGGISKKRGSSGENRPPLTVAISGCSNGCSHPLTSAIGIVAEGPRVFRVFVGGDGRSLGISLGTVDGPSGLADLVRAAAERFRAEGDDSERFVDWWNRRRNRGT